MLRSESSSSTLQMCAAHPGIRGLCVLIAFLTLVPTSFGQTFTVQMTAFSGKGVIDPGGSATANVTIGGSISGTVGLTCQATSQQTGVTPPTCQVSPASVSPPASATAIVTSTGSTTPGLYTIIVTGTSTGLTPQTAQAFLTVQSVAPGFTITVQSAVVPSSVHAGSGGQGIISVNPLNGYIGVVTLSCASITPLVTIPPICSFTYASGPDGVQVNGVPNTATIQISTYGPITTGAVVRPKGFSAFPKGFSALWLPLLALVGVGAAAGGKRSRTAWGMLALFVLGGSLLLLPGCGTNTSTSTTTPNGVTPNNSYSFTLVGVDTAGSVSSNTGTGTTNTVPTVTLTVD